MIARLWSARTTPALSDSYLQHFTESVRPQLGRVAGFLGATVSTRPAPGSVEILVTTYWASFAAIDAFAGADREAAVVAAEAAALLTDYDRRVRHYEVAIAEFPSTLAR
jgi:heme-degrading monooxygenase HmoA